MNRTYEIQRILRLSILLTCLALLPTVALAHEGNHAGFGDGAFSVVLFHYEAVRVALVHDHVDGVGEHAAAIHQAIEGLRSGFSAGKAGVRADKESDARGLLSLLADASSALVAAQDLTAARDAFYELSKPLVRWRSMATGELPVVAYCSMAKRSWLQPEGALGNPYYGQSMEECGEVVS